MLEGGPGTVGFAANADAGASVASIVRARRTARSRDVIEPHRSCLRFRLTDRVGLRRPRLPQRADGRSGNRAVFGSPERPTKIPGFASLPHDRFALSRSVAGSLDRARVSTLDRLEFALRGPSVPI